MEVINRANNALVLFKLLCDQLKIEHKTQLLPFGEKFAYLQQDARKYESELADLMKSAIQKETENNKQVSEQQLQEVEAEIEQQRKKFRADAHQNGSVV